MSFLIVRRSEVVRGGRADKGGGGEVNVVVHEHTEYSPRRFLAVVVKSGVDDGEATISTGEETRLFDQ